MIKDVFTSENKVDNTDSVIVPEISPIPFITSFHNVDNESDNDVNEIKPVSLPKTNDETNHRFRGLTSKVRDQMDKPSEDSKEALVFISKNNVKPVVSTSKVLSHGRGSFFGNIPGARLVPAGSRVVDSSLETDSVTLNNVGSVQSNLEQVLFEDENIVPGSFSSSRSNLKVAPVHERPHVKGSRSSNIESNILYEEENVVPGSFSNSRSNSQVQTPVDSHSSSRKIDKTVTRLFSQSPNSDSAFDNRNVESYTYYEPSQNADSSEYYDPAPVPGSFSSDFIQDEYTLSSNNDPDSARASQTFIYNSDLPVANYDSYLPGSVRINSDSRQYSVDYAENDLNVPESFRTAPTNIAAEPITSRNTPTIYDPYNNNPFRTENRQVFFKFSSNLCFLKNI